MKKKAFQEIAGSIVAPLGFRAAGVFCDIKRLGTGKGSDKGAKRDLTIIASDVSASAAGMFTTNQICAAPVKLCVEHIQNGQAQAIVVNSGNANACTGKIGMRDAKAMAAAAAKLLKLDTADVMVGSTGRIGVTMPMPNVQAGIAAAFAELGSEIAKAEQAAEAIMTSDTRPKQIAVEFSLGGKKVRIGGICKGAGMIQPGMSATGARPAAMPLHATMLCFITSDAAIAPKLLQAALQQAVALSFNRITIDGDMSTNDTVLVLANGLAAHPKLAKKTDAELPMFQAALNHVCLALAQMIVRDGEGASRFVTIRVDGARNDKEADAAARSVANSALVKTSWHGGDPNWGRIIDSLGYSSARIEEAKVDIGYSAPGAKKVLFSLRAGQPTKASFAELCAAVAAPEFELHIRLHLGHGEAVIYAADLTEEYVEFNKGDVSDPSSLGG